MPVTLPMATDVGWVVGSAVGWAVGPVVSVGTAVGELAGELWQAMAAISRSPAIIVSAVPALTLISVPSLGLFFCLSNTTTIFVVFLFHRSGEQVDPIGGEGSQEEESCSSLVREALWRGGERTLSLDERPRPEAMAGPDVRDPACAGGCQRSVSNRKNSAGSAPSISSERATPASSSSTQAISCRSGIAPTQRRSTIPSLLTKKVTGNPITP